jgi:hypothetical protein
VSSTLLVASSIKKLAKLDGRKPFCLPSNVCLLCVVYLLSVVCSSLLVASSIKKLAKLDGRKLPPSPPVVALLLHSCYTVVTLLSNSPSMKKLAKLEGRKTLHPSFACCLPVCGLPVCCLPGCCLSSFLLSPCGLIHQEAGQAGRT